MRIGYILDQKTKMEVYKMANIKSSLYMNEDLNSYVEEESKKLGVGKSGFINMIISQYREQQIMKKEVYQLSNYLERLEKLMEESKKS